MIEQIARQHSHLEQAAQHALPPALGTSGHRSAREYLFDIILSLKFLFISFFLSLLFNFFIYMNQFQRI